MCVLAKQEEGGMRSKSGSRAEFPCGMGSGEKVDWPGWLGSKPRPQGLSKAAHTCSDMQQIVKALHSYA